MVISGVMGAAVVWASGIAEWRAQTQEPPGVVRRAARPRAYAARKSDRAIAMSVFHAARLSQTGRLKQGASSAKTSPMPRSTIKPARSR
jgi:hypothetical protein